LAPILFWVAASIVLHKLGTRNYFEPSWMYPLFFGPALTFVLIVAIARYLPDKIYGDYYTGRKIGWDSKKSSDYYHEAIARSDYTKAKQVVIFKATSIVKWNFIELDCWNQ
jgi:hypothetical protein